MSLFCLLETEKINQTTRATLPGDFINLRDGVTHYELRGPEDAQTIVLVHGFSVPAYIWDPTFAALVEAGFRVLRYDLFGRGTSDRPSTTYGPDLYDRQLLDLLGALDIDLPVDLVGLSMGGPIVTTFCDRHPEKVRNLILIDPVGGKPITLSSLSIFGELPGIGALLFDWLGNKILLKGIADDFFKPQNIERFVDRYKEQMVYKGFKRALIRSLRSDMLGDFSSTYKRVGEQDRSKLLIWGREDHTVPFAHSQIILEFMPDTEFHVIKNAGHIPHYERPEIVSPLLIAFLR